MKPFNDARSRLNRAIAQGKSLALFWNSIPAEDFFGVKANADRDGRGTIRVVRVGVIREDFSLLLGEMLYQLRSGLDACIYQATIYATGKNPPPDDSQLEFPLCPNQPEFLKQAKRRLSALPQNIQNEIERLQPYNTPSLPPEDMIKDLNRSLAILHDLARKDRHRRLHVVGAWPYHLDPKFTLPPGVTMDSLTITTLGVLEEGSILATFQLKGFSWGMNIQVNPWLRTQVGLNEPPLPCHASDTFDRRLEEMINAVGSVIAAFERYF
jgi:hypothetical protein